MLHNGIVRPGMRRLPGRRHAARNVLGHCSNGGVVESGSCRQLHIKAGCQGISQIHCAKRIQPGFHEGLLRGHARAQYAGNNAGDAVPVTQAADLLQGEEPDQSTEAAASALVHADDISAAQGRGDPALPLQPLA